MVSSLFSENESGRAILDFREIFHFIYTRPLNLTWDFFVVLCQICSHPTVVQDINKYGCK